MAKDIEAQLQDMEARIHRVLESVRELRDILEKMGVQCGADREVRLLLHRFSGELRRYQILRSVAIRANTAAEDDSSL